jgi:predicted NUDIX family NTP pyrophosphohydrolase
LFAVAQREFEEELGIKPEGEFIQLSPVKQKGGKVVHAWAFEGDCDPAAITSNTVTIEWPPRSGRQMEIPEVDRADFFDMETAKKRINAAQIGLLEELVQELGNR